jgi:N-acetylglucosaminyldiphosphoundecaprenol N-acetyl-beta-D-mannosaminyltransferase
LTTLLDRRVTADLFGIVIDRLTMDETVARIREMVRGRGLHQHVVVNAAKIVALAHDPELLEVIRSCDMVNADGMSVVWASRLLGDPLPERVAGIDLFERLVRTASEDGTSVYFLGATEEVVEQVAAVYSQRYPGLRIAGSQNGYWDDDEAVVAAVRACAPDYLFLAIPSPRKEFWVRDHLEALGTPFVMGVGGSFDVIAGKVARAPRWAQQSGLEWAWRLAQEPRRMWRRYLYTNSAFVRITVRAWLRRRA